MGKRARLLATAVAVILSFGLANAAGSDISRGHSARKETLCHIPPGNPANAHAIVVNEWAVSAHLAHGDTIGECPEECEGPPAPLAKTGQTLCYSDGSDGDLGSPPEVIPCEQSGQDGQYQLGVSVDPRFTDNRDGTVTDNLTGLIWLKDADCFGLQNWSDALSMARTLAQGSCGLTDGSAVGDWRLPNVRELESLLDYGTHSPALPPGHPFLGVLPDAYWSSSTHLELTGSAWRVNPYYNDVGFSNKHFFVELVWPVRGPGKTSGRGKGRQRATTFQTLCHVPPGDPKSRHTIEVSRSAVSAHLAHGDAMGACPGECDDLPAPVAKTGQRDCYDVGGIPIPCEETGQDGEHRHGAAVDPRFTDNGDGTITDNLTDVVWLQDADCFGFQYWAGALEVVQTLADGACGLTDGSTSGDWRLPNVRELSSLLDYGTLRPALPRDHPFLGVQLNYYWSSTTLAVWPWEAFIVNHYFNHVRAEHKLVGVENVWPVRGGQ